MKFTRAYSSAAGLGNTIPSAKVKYVPTSGTYPKGFSASGIFVGVKASNTSKPDLAIITSDRPCAAAGVFTKNKFQAAPVTFSRKLLEKKANSGLRSVIINSGCANAVTGTGGLQDATKMSQTTDKRVGAEDSTLVMSTGVIGQRCVPFSGPIGSLMPPSISHYIGCRFRRFSTTSLWRTIGLEIHTNTGSTVPRLSAPRILSLSSCLEASNCPRPQESSIALRV